MAKKKKKATKQSPKRSLSGASGGREEQITLNMANVEVLRRHDMPTQWVDSMQVIVRKDVPLAMMFFNTFDPLEKKGREVGRFMMTRDHALRIIEVMCRTLDHYPQKPDEANHSA